MLFGQAYQLSTEKVGGRIDGIIYAVMMLGQLRQCVGHRLEFTIVNYRIHHIEELILGQDGSRLDQVEQRTERIFVRIGHWVGQDLKKIGHGRGGFLQLTTVHRWENCLFHQELDF